MTYETLLDMGTNRFIEAHDSEHMIPAMAFAQKLLLDKIYESGAETPDGFDGCEITIRLLIENKVTEEDRKWFNDNFRFTPKPTPISHWSEATKLLLFALSDDRHFHLSSALVAQWYCASLLLGCKHGFDHPGSMWIETVLIDQLNRLSSSA